MPLVAEGKLPCNEQTNPRVLELTREVYRTFGLVSRSATDVSAFTPAAAQVLLAAREDGCVMDIFSADVIQAGNEQFGGDRRGYARYKAALQLLQRLGLLENSSEEVAWLTDDGYNVADDLAAAAASRPETEP
jgi:hypothetical protein